MLANLSKAKVVAIDAALGGTKSIKGIELTNLVALQENLDVTVEVVISPQDNDDVIERNFNNESIDLVFIDALHTDEAQTNDFLSVLPYTSDRTIFIFHDVLSYKMEASFKGIGADLNSHRPIIFHRTTSGIGGLFPIDLDCLLPLFEAYSEDEVTLSCILQKLDRSLAKSKFSLLVTFCRVWKSLRIPNIRRIK